MGGKPTPPCRAGQEGERGPRSNSVFTPRMPDPHPGCRSGGLGMGLLKPSAHQPVRSCALPWGDTREGRACMPGVRAGGAQSKWKRIFQPASLFSSVRPRTS